MNVKKKVKLMKIFLLVIANSSILVAQKNQVDTFLRKTFQSSTSNVWVENIEIKSNDSFCNTDSSKSELMFLFKDSLFYEVIPFRVNYNDDLSQIIDLNFTENNFRKLLTIVYYQNLKSKGLSYKEVIEVIEKNIGIQLVESIIPYHLNLKNDDQTTARYRLSLAVSTIECDKQISILEFKNQIGNECDVFLRLDEIISKTINQNTEQFTSYLFNLNLLILTEKNVKEHYFPVVIDR